MDFFLVICNTWHLLTGIELHSPLPSHGHEYKVSRSFCSDKQSASNDTGFGILKPKTSFALTSLL